MHRFEWPTQFNDVVQDVQVEGIRILVADSDVTLTMELGSVEETSRYVAHRPL